MSFPARRIHGTPEHSEMLRFLDERIDAYNQYLRDRRELLRDGKLPQLPPYFTVNWYLGWATARRLYDGTPICSVTANG